VISSDTDQGIIDTPSDVIDNELTFTPSNWEKVQTIIILSDEGKTQPSPIRNESETV
jgi:hypothetical protein